MLAEGQQVELTIEKPASGGWMIARHLGQIVLVRGAIPGERVTAWIERAEKRLAYAVTRDVLTASPDRRSPVGDPLCGGALYAHIAYPRQLAIKAEVIQDAFERVGRHRLERIVDVAGSPEERYRMRARLHMIGSRVGFYREGTHQLCDAGPTRQLSADAIDAARSIAAAVDRDAARSSGTITITENIAGDQRAAHLDLDGDARVTPGLVDRMAADAGVTGISARASGFVHLRAGSPWVADPLSAVTGHPVEGELRRQAESFFQGNRFLLPALVHAVMECVPREGGVLELYAGVGLFSVALAVRGTPVVAVEGDRASGADLTHNAREHARLEPIVANVEDYLKRAGPERTLLVDPPRTGLSKPALEGVIRRALPRVVYVSCDPPTLARDARRLLDAGYDLTSIRAFDLFPNTPHVEAISVFDRAPNRQA